MIDPSLDFIRKQLGPPKRHLKWFAESPLAFPVPPWLRDVSIRDDPVKELFSAFGDMWKHGVVVWGHVVRANVGLYEPGEDDCPGTMIFSPTESDDVAFALLPQLAERLNELRSTALPNDAWTPREKEWWEDLRNDMSFHRGFMLPAEWQVGAGDYKGSSLVFHRYHLPDGVIQSRLLPILVDPTRSLAQVIPASHWPHDLKECLRQQQVPASRATTNFPIFGDSVDHLAEHRPGRNLLEQAYQNVFGPIASVLHEILPSPHHIDIYRFEWTPPRQEVAYVSGGMSDAIQPSGGEFGRIELVLYAKKHSELYLNLVHNFTRYPWETGASIAPGTTIPLGCHAEAVVGSERFPALLFLPGVARPESPLHEMPVIRDSQIRLLSIIPITHAELETKVATGLQSLLDQMRDSHFDIAFDPNRPSLF